MISESTLNSIRQSIDLVELIGEYLPLKKSGQGFVGLCPFHGEKTPSFHVHPAKQCFHCFGCHKGGNIFTFIREIEGLNFPQAVQKLAKRVGIVIEESTRPRPLSPQEKIPAAQRESLFKALEWATKYFHYLLTEVSEFEDVRRYLASRKISEASIKRFRLGVSPSGWNTLLDLMLKRNFSLETLVSAGLVVPKEDSPQKGYDRFRDRLMFPIRDMEENVLGFGARLLKDEPQQPKYLNSPESPLFSKRQIFYGLYENQRGIRLRQEAILVEGYMDVVGLSEYGVQNAIATMGTAVTEEHCYQLKALTRKVVTVFDPDASGQEAWKRSVHLFLQSGIFAKDLFLPNGKDPDEFIQSEGAENFYALCEKAPRQITKILKEIASQGPLSEEQSAQWLEALTPALVALRNAPDRALLMDDVSLVLKLSLPALQEHIRQTALAHQTRAQNNKAVGSKEVFTPPKRTSPHINPVPKLDPLELEFLKTALNTPIAFKASGIASTLPQLFREPSIRHWMEKLINTSSAAQQMAALEELVQNETNPTLQALASQRLLQAVPKSPANEDEGAVALLQDLLKRLQQRKREQEIKALTAEVRLAERQGDLAEGIRLLERLKDLRAAPLM